MNKVILIGNVGKDPEMRTLESGVKVAKATVATSERWKDKQGEWQEKTQWHTIIGWRYAADSIGRIEKGDKVVVEGKIETRSYEKDGEKKYVTEIIADSVKRLNKREGNATESMAKPNTNAPATLTDESGDLPF